MLLFVVRCWLLVVRCWSCVDCCLWVLVRGSLSVVGSCLLVVFVC